MMYNNYNFSSKLKFCFSFLFISLDNYVKLTNFYGEKLEIKEINYILNKEFNSIKKYYDKIDLEDKHILKLFDEEEVINYFENYSLNNKDFDIDDPVCLEDFYAYMIKEKVNEKKRLDYGTIYDLFDTFSDEEIILAVANLKADDKKKFIELFGVKGDKLFEINKEDEEKNDILIKIYTYILKRRRDSSVKEIISDVFRRGAVRYNFYDYIRYICGDPNLSKEFIYNMFSKMDYNSKNVIKEVFGQNLEKKKVVVPEKKFNNAINTLKVIIDVNKKYEKNKQETFKRKKAGVDEEKKSKEQTKEKEEEPKEEIKKEQEQIKEDKKDINEEIEKKDVKEDKKEEVVPVIKENKKKRLNKFLLENNITKKDFLVAITLLDLDSKRIVELYYGIDTEAYDIDMISIKMSMPEDDIYTLLENAQDDIIKFIKTGKVKEVQKAKAKKPKEKLKEYISNGEEKKNAVIKSMIVLLPIEKVALDMYLGINGEAKKTDQIAIVLAKEEQEVEKIIDDASSKIIEKLEIEDKEINKEEKTEIKSEEKEIKEEKKEEEPKKEEVKEIKHSSLFSDFLHENNITKEEYFKGVKVLGGKQRAILELYLGVYAAGLSISYIAKRYGKTEEEIEDIISDSKSKLLSAISKNKDGKEVKISLLEFLIAHNISKKEFNKYLNDLPALKKGMLSSYFGIGTKELSLKELSIKYNKSPNAINMMVNNSLNDILKLKQKDTLVKKQENRLTKFLRVNNISKKEFEMALELLSGRELGIISLYFGVNGKEASVIEIANSIGGTPKEAKDEVGRILSKVKFYAKSEDLEDMYSNNKYKRLSGKINRLYGTLLKDAAFLALLAGISPIALQALQTINMFDLSIEQAAKTLMISNNELLNTLSSISVACENYMENMTKTTIVSYQDTENSIRRNKAM